MIGLTVSSFYQRLYSIRGVQLCATVATILSILISFPLWKSNRNFPTAPVLASIEIPETLNNLLLFLLFGSFVSAIFYSKNGFNTLISILLLSLFFLLDLNRLQPEFYFYFVVLVLLYFYQKKTISENVFFQCLALLLVGVYLWSGVHKINESYFELSFKWMTAPITNQLPESILLSLINGFGHATPYIEFLLAIGLLIRPTRKVSVIGIVLMHLFILICLGPFGRDFNYVVFPWNILMVFLVTLLFWKKVTNTYLYKPTIAAFTSSFVFILLPALNLLGAYDAYLSFDLYSGKYKEGVLYIHESVLPNLPKELQPYVHKTPENQYRIILTEWAQEEVKVPPYPEIRVFKRYRNYIQNFSDDRRKVGLVLYSQGKYTRIN